MVKMIIQNLLRDGFQVIIFDPWIKKQTIRAEIASSTGESGLAIWENWRPDWMTVRKGIFLTTCESRP